MLQPSFTKTNRKALLAVIGLVVVLAGYTLTRGADSKIPAVGAAAPDFTLTSQDGTPVNLHDFKGKWVVLYFYPKDFTSGCTTEAHNFQRDLPQYQARNAVILGVSVQDADSHKQFCAKEGLNFKLFADTNKKSERTVWVSDEFWRGEAFRAAHIPDQSRWSDCEGIRGREPGQAQRRSARGSYGTAVQVASVKRAELSLHAGYLRNARVAAKWPHRPWTPPPGGVDAEQI